MRASEVLLLAWFATTGCVEYARVERGSVRPDEELRVRVNDETAVRLAQQFGRITEEVTARVEPQGADSLALTVWLGRDYPGTQFENVRQRVVLDNDEVTDLLRRRLSVWRSAAAGIGVIAVTALMVNRIFLIEDPNDPDDNGETPPPAILFRFVIPGR